MSPVLEQDAEELEVLVGATIEKVWVQEPDPSSEYYDYEYPVVRMRVRFRQGLRVNNKRHGEYEVWQDPEGNGPGFFSLVG
jgi:hypothetical protein